MKYIPNATLIRHSGEGRNPESPVSREHGLITANWYWFTPVRSLTSIGKLDKDELIEPLQCARGFGKTLFPANNGDNEEVMSDLYRRFVRVGMNCRPRT